MPLPVNLPEERLQPERQASTVFAIDGTPIGVFKGAETQVEVSKENIPDTIRRAVVAAEDHRFFKHRGVDWQAIGRALQEDVKAGEFVQGGSTITQQLIRNLYTGSERTMVRKAREALLAVQAERVLSKEEILARYLNTVYLGESTFGVEAASQSYFRKPAKDISLSEAALLAGVIPAPSVFSPRANPRTGRAEAPTGARPAGPLPDGHPRGGRHGPGGPPGRPSRRPGSRRSTRSSWTTCARTS